MFKWIKQLLIRLRILKVKPPFDTLIATIHDYSTFPKVSNTDGDYGALILDEGKLYLTDVFCYGTFRKDGKVFSTVDRAIVTHPDTKDIQCRVAIYTPLSEEEWLKSREAERTKWSKNNVKYLYEGFNGDMVDESKSS